VLVAVSGSEQEAVDTLEGLTSARNYIRRTVAERLRLRTAPELHFRLDKSEQYGARIDELLRRLSKNRKKA
jgi:ribosome-binding factor A